MITLESFVRGAWQRGNGRPKTLQDPTRETDIAHCDSTGLDFAGAVAWGRGVGGTQLRKVGFAERGRWLKALSAAIHAKRDALIAVSAENGGSTRGDAKFDLDGATGTLAAYAKLAESLGDENFLPDGEGVQLGRTPRYWGQHIRVPRPGVAVHINAFNFPAWGMCEKLACSVLAGVPAISKPGTPTALVAYRVAQVIAESGVLPEGAFQFVCGSLGDTLDHLGPQDTLAFTGSAKTGAMLKGHARLVGANTRVTLEADSLNCAILAPEIDDDAATWAAFVNNLVTDMTQKTGQKCTAVRRILVPRERVDAVVENLVDRLGRIAIGDPADEATKMGPLASGAQFEDVSAGMQALLAVARAACGGPTKLTARGYFLAPTLLVANDPDAEVLHSLEVFGPCATVIPYDGRAAEATRLANRGGGGLVASIYANDKRWTEDLVLGIAPWHGRLWVCSDKVADQAYAPGMVLPQTIHGGPGRAGGGEELGGLRGLELYLQRVALQGDQGHLGRRFGPSTGSAAV
ncbi:MAG: 3,4-dehydroadipyl-CoA semialdehyde dehydrogenase [Planctomycetes bacterium]|nr:3,4-dehydroadipyl-CoA semialdehyde dehydrogenase [Planctomycetota bacterium]